MVVHATSKFMTVARNRAVLVAGKLDEKNEPIDGALGWRPTVHFALNKLADDIKENKLSQREYCFIIPFEKVENRLLGMKAEDTYFLGDVTVPDGSILIAPKDRCNSLQTEHSLLRVVPKEQDLAKQVKRYCPSQGVPNINYTYLKDIHAHPSRTSSTVLPSRKSTLPRIRSWRTPCGTR